MMAATMMSDHCPKRQSRRLSFGHALRGEGRLHLALISSTCMSTRILQTCRNSPSSLALWSIDKHAEKFIQWSMTKKVVLSSMPTNKATVIGMPPMLTVRPAVAVALGLETVPAKHEKHNSTRWTTSSPVHSTFNSDEVNSQHQDEIDTGGTHREVPVT